MSLSLVEAPTKFHLSINVSDLGRGIAFYRVLFGVEPAKQHHDYAKFELDEPPVVFSLVPRPRSSGGTLSHAGLRVCDASVIDAVRQRLETAGIRTEMQECTTCGYARQRKCWVTDPDGLYWEIYVVEEDIDPKMVRRSLEGRSARLEAPRGPATWEHCIGHPLPNRISCDDASADEVRLVGTFNAMVTGDALRQLLTEARRVLKPGGKLFVHALVADAPLSGRPPALPGVAALVQRVPEATEVLGALREAGFGAIALEKYTERPWFVHDGVGLREAQVIGWAPAPGGSATRFVLYKGPFAEAASDGGQVFPRGRRVAVSPATWDLLRKGAAAEQFLFLDPDAPATGTCR
jgi:catechol 2,3-dioxygenase-like lactoylglutathione lyase family enzyme